MSLKLRFKTSRDKFISILSYSERNGVEAGIQLSSRFLGIRIQIPSGMAKASINLVKINRLLCSLVLLGLSVPGLNPILGNTSIWIPAEGPPDRTFVQRVTTIEGNNSNDLILRQN